MAIETRELVKARHFQVQPQATIQANVYQMLDIINARLDKIEAQLKSDCESLREKVQCEQL